MATSQSPRDTASDIIAWAAARESIRAVLLTSTRAIPDAHTDALSDYDVILIVQDAHPFVNDRSWLNDFGDVLVAYWDPSDPCRHSFRRRAVWQCDTVCRWAED